MHVAGNRWSRLHASALEATAALIAPDMVSATDETIFHVIIDAN
jgi:hypothetical protein